MKQYGNGDAPSLEDVTEMLSKMKTLLIDVLLEKSLPDASRIKLKDCISMLETFSRFLNNVKKDEENSEDFLQPLHSGLSKSMECLNVESHKLSSSKSASDLTSFDSYDNDEVEDFDINNLKESYLRAVNEFNKNHELNDNTELAVPDSKSEVNSDKPEINHANSEIKATKTDINSNKEANYCKPAVNGANSELNVSNLDVNVSKAAVKREGGGSKRRRKRDSSTLFDISLDDLTEPDHSGFLTEKHSGQEWWCVLQDQHLCMFPSQNPQELAYDVLLVPCCEISLDDVYTESPVFRLTQVGSTPWVFSAGIERNLRAWIRALYRACGRDDADWSMRSSKKGRRRDKTPKRNMKVFTSTIDESEEMEEQEVREENEIKVEEQHGTEDAVKGAENNEMVVTEEPSNVGEDEVDEKTLTENKNSENREELETVLPHEMSEREDQSMASNVVQEGKVGESQVEDCQEVKGLAAQENLVENGSSSLVDDDHDDYVIKPPSPETPGTQDYVRSNSLPARPSSAENLTMQTLERKATKKRIKMLRWLKKAFRDKEQDDVTVIGDIYKIEGPDNHVKVWCLLRDRQLMCYPNVSDTTPSFTLPLNNCIAVPSSASSTKKYVFDVEKNGAKVATFAARSAKERARWIEIVKTKRGTIPLGDFADDSEEDTGSEEDEDDGYVKMDHDEPNTKNTADSVYVMPNEIIKEMQDSGYISVLALECEVSRQQSRRMDKKYNPNITNKAVIEHLIEKETPYFLRTIPKDHSSPYRNRSPAPLPKAAALLAKRNSDPSQDVPAILVHSSGENIPENGLEEKVLEETVMCESQRDLNNNSKSNSLERASVEPANDRLETKSKGKKKDKSRPTSPSKEKPRAVSPTTARKAHVQLKKEDISKPMDPSCDCLITALVDPFDFKENAMKLPSSAESQSNDNSESPASMESRIKLREKLLSKEKREQITKLEVLKKHVDQAKDRMIVVDTSGQLKREAVESEHDFLIANLELVKAKRRLIDIETEVRELRLFVEKYSSEQLEEGRPKEIVKPPPKPALKRRPSKEVMVYTDADSPAVDPEAFNSPGDPPPLRKVMDNVKLFETLQMSYPLAHRESKVESQ